MATLKSEEPPRVVNDIAVLNKVRSLELIIEGSSGRPNFPWPFEAEDFGSKYIQPYVILASLGCVMTFKWLSTFEAEQTIFTDMLNERLIYMAARYAQREMISFLINERGCSVNCTIDTDGRVLNAESRIIGGNPHLPMRPCGSGHGPQSALMCASENGDLATLKLLLINGAVVDQADEMGTTALMIAVFGTNIKVIECLLEHGANADLKDFDYMSALWYACAMGKSEIVKLFLKHGISVNPVLDDTTKEYEKEFSPKSALLVAIDNGQVEIIRILLNAGASLSSDQRAKLSQEVCALIDRIRTELQSVERDKTSAAQLPSLSIHSSHKELKPSSGDISFKNDGTQPYF